MMADAGPDGAVGGEGAATVGTATAGDGAVGRVKFTVGIDSPTKDAVLVAANLFTPDVPRDHSIRRGHRPRHPSPRSW
jgi:hypothetical protein